MAIDTRDKRASCIGIDGPYRFVLPNPAGSVDQGDRQQIAFKYSGITAAQRTGKGFKGAGRRFYVQALFDLEKEAALGRMSREQELVDRLTAEAAEKWVSFQEAKRKMVEAAIFSTLMTEL